MKEEVKKDKEEPFFDIEIEYDETTSGYVSINFRFPTKEFHELKDLMQNPKVMRVLCKAGESTGINKVLSGSTWCATSYKTGAVTKIEQHQFEAKNWFNAFWAALWYCGGPSFQLYRGKCRTDLPIQHH